MVVDTLRLFDGTFAHSKLGFCSDYQTSKYFHWDRQTPEKDCQYLVYTDMRLNQAAAANKDRNVAWLIEPMCIAKQNYDLIRNIQGRFSKILTHEEELLKLGAPYEFVPFGCCWIPEKDQKIYDKTKDVSIIASSKRMTDGHNIRHDVIRTLRDKMDVYGRGWNPVEHKVEALAPYRYSVVIENCARKGWFTEKLIDCFATGTIPLYWGAPDIGDFFNSKGIITFNNVEELSDIVDNLDVKRYLDTLPHIRENFEIMKKYLLPDDWVLSKVKGYEGLRTLI